jgi:hypothetical protein
VRGLGRLIGSLIDRRLVLELSLLVAGLGLAWTLLCGGIFLVLWGGVALVELWLVPWAAVTLVGATGVIAAAILLRVGRRQPRPRLPSSTQLGRALVAAYPLEVVAAAAATGFAVASSPQLRGFLLREVARRARITG